MELGKENNVWRSFLKDFAGFKSKKVKKGFEGVIWLAVCCCICLEKSAVVFRNDLWSVPDLIWSIKVTTWRWSFHGEINQLE